MSKYVIKKSTDLMLDTDTLEFRYSQGDEYIVIRGSDLKEPLFVLLEDLAALVEFKKAIDDLA